MTIFIAEFLFYLVYILSALVMLSIAVLFVLAYAVEAKLRTPWRLLGFLMLATAFLLAIVGRRFVSVDAISAVFEMISVILIFIGVRSELDLSVLLGVGPDKATADEISHNLRPLILPAAIVVLVSVGGGLAIRATLADSNWSLVVVTLLTIVPIVGTIILQIRRYLRSRDLKQTVRGNRSAIAFYVFLLVHNIVQLVMYLPGIPESHTNFWFGVNIASLLIAAGFALRWIWDYVRVRASMRILVALLAVSAVVSSLGALGFTVQSYAAAEAASSKTLSSALTITNSLIADRQATLRSVTANIAHDSVTLAAVKSHAYMDIASATQDLLQTSQISSLRVIDIKGLLVASPTDSQIVGNDVGNDPLVNAVISTRKSYDTIGMISLGSSQKLGLRSLAPLVLNGNIIGVIELDIYLDKAIVEFAKHSSGVDLTLTLGDGSVQATTLSIDPSSVSSSYPQQVQQLQNEANTSVGTLTAIDLGDQGITDARLQLVSSFLVLSLVSVGISGAGYVIARKFQIAG